MYVFFALVVYLRLDKFIDERRLAYAGVNIHEDSMDTLKASRVEPRSSPLDPVRKEHDAHHLTLAQFHASNTTGHRRMVPSPQRSKGDGTDTVYTKRVSNSKAPDETNDI